MFKLFNRLARDKRGFTLVELIVVIAVLGILAGIAVPRLTGVQDKAKNSAIMTSAGSIKDAMEMYHAENNKYPKEEEISNWSSIDTTLDTIDLPPAGEEEGKVPVNAESVTYEVNNNNNQFLITLPSSINDYEVYIGEKAVVDSNGGNTSDEASELGSSNNENGE